MFHFHFISEKFGVLETKYNNSCLKRLKKNTEAPKYRAPLSSKYLTSIESRRLYNLEDCWPSISSRALMSPNDLPFRCICRFGLWLSRSLGHQNVGLPWCGFSRTTGSFLTHHAHCHSWGRNVGQWKTRMQTFWKRKFPISQLFQRCCFPDAVMFWKIPHRSTELFFFSGSFFPTQKSSKRSLPPLPTLRRLITTASPLLSV